jgi:hypothetical protein
VENTGSKNSEPLGIFPERLFWFRSPALLSKLRRETRKAERDQCVKLTLMPVEKIMSLDFVPTMGGLVT